MQWVALVYASIMRGQQKLPLVKDFGPGDVSTDTSSIFKARPLPDRIPSKTSSITNHDLGFLVD